ncbi:hypothetical protein [Lysobacter gummosus]|uniref:hypothetical protein n=1 Tax=Lysobacter gummosus TaxID=262324 RepID=UPI00363C4CF1
MIGRVEVSGVRRRFALARFVWLRLDAVASLGFPRDVALSRASSPFEKGGRGIRFCRCPC